MRRGACADLRVALRKESVDRNVVKTQLVKGKDRSLSARRVWIEIQAAWSRGRWRDVALRKESVDRNRIDGRCGINRFEVALRKESVDRNLIQRCVADRATASLSARRVWIEIRRAGCHRRFRKSLSARRVWIEIRLVALTSTPESVALRKESVDRNNSDLAF